MSQIPVRNVMKFWIVIEGPPIDDTDNKMELIKIVLSEFVREFKIGFNENANNKYIMKCYSEYGTVIEEI